MDLWVLYRENKDFHDYVDKYCVKHQITPDEAIRHVVVKAYAEQLDKRTREVVLYADNIEMDRVSADDPIIKACGGC